MKRMMLLLMLGLLVELGVTAKSNIDLIDSSLVGKIDKWQSALPLNFAGSVDAYVQTNFVPKQTNDVLNEVFSHKANSFQLGMINFMLSKEIKKVGFMADVGFGPRADVANNTLYSSSIIAIKQLYVTYTPADWIQFTLGNFSTFFGYEVIEPEKNFHYSTSLGFQNGPFYHTGFKANFTKEKFNFLVGIFDDTDHKSDNDRNKFVGTQLGYSGDKISGYLNWIGGNQSDLSDTTNAYKDYKSSLGFTGTANLGKKEKGLMVLDFAWHRFRYKQDKGDDATHTQNFITYLYGRYNIKDNFGIGARLGYSNAGVAYALPLAAKHFVDITITGNITISDFLRVVPEFRMDYADRKVYTNRMGNNNNFQHRLLLATIFSF
ncbi:MAG: porin [Chitinophagales bacterium]|nr:porin [Chitinophagales bacterium]